MGCRLRGDDVSGSLERARVVGVRVGKNVSCDRRSGQYGPSASFGRGVPLKGLEESQLAALTPAAGGGRLLARRHGAASYERSARAENQCRSALSDTKKPCKNLKTIELIHLAY